MVTSISIRYASQPVPFSNLNFLLQPVLSPLLRLFILKCEVLLVGLIPFLLSGTCRLALPVFPYAGQLLWVILKSSRGPRIYWNLFWILLDQWLTDLWSAVLDRSVPDLSHLSLCLMMDPDSLILKFWSLIVLTRSSYGVLLVPLLTVFLVVYFHQFFRFDLALRVQALGLLLVHWTHPFWL